MKFVIYIWITILSDFFIHSNTQYNRDNYEKLNRILHSFLNRRRIETTMKN